MKKQTAVEWLEKIRHGQKGQPFDDYEWEIAFNHAKEMEKEQMIEAYDEGYSIRDYYGNRSDNTTSEQYYNQTFKSEEE